MQLPFDDARRRRLYLVRHGESAAARESDGLYGDEIALTERGLAEATAMADVLRDVPFGAVYSSDIARARQTAQIIVGARRLAVTSSNIFTEIRGDIGTVILSDMTPIERQARFAYAMWDADAPDALFFGGDAYRSYLDRTAATLMELVRTVDAPDILIVSHSGFQRAALCWALDASPLGLAKFEQDTCCLNILDIDVDSRGAIVRKHVRLANHTPLDPVKIGLRLTDGERLAQRFVPN
jgi:probable phosphoglycerate mutase